MDLRVDFVDSLTVATSSDLFTIVSSVIRNSYQQNAFCALGQALPVEVSAIAIKWRTVELIAGSVSRSAEMRDESFRSKKTC